MAYLNKPLKPRHSTRVTKTVEQGLTRYRNALCPYSVKVNRVLDRLKIGVGVVNPDRKVSLHNKLTKQSGRYQLACLQLGNSKDTPVWMHESHNIIRYLNHRFTSEKAK